MAKYQKQHGNQSTKTIQEAKAIARATQKPGQTKEQTRLVAQGVQKGIEQYKKQQKAKARELDKRLKSAKVQPDNVAVDAPEEIKVIVRHHWLPWCMLLLSWFAMGVILLK